MWIGVGWVNVTAEQSDSQLVTCRAHERHDNLQEYPLQDQQSYDCSQHVSRYQQKQKLRDRLLQPRW